MLETFVQGKDDPKTGKQGSGGPVLYLNSLRRFVNSGIVVPREDNNIAKMAAATGAQSPGRSNVIPIEGPQDARTELFSHIGAQGLSNLGAGTISVAGNVVTGVNTKFLEQLLVGDTIRIAGSSETVATITSNTALTTIGINLNGAAAAAYAYSTPIVAAVRDRMTVEITDTAWQRNLMNRDVICNHVFGSNRKPLFLRENVLLETNQTLLYRFYNNSTAGTGSLGFSLEGRKWQAEAMKRKAVADYIAHLRKRKIWCQPYWLTLDDGIVTLTASGSLTKFLTCTGDLTLVLFYMYGQVITSGVAGDTQEKISIELRDENSGRSMQNQAFTLNTGTGTPENPFIFPSPWIIMPQTQIKADFTNLITDATSDVALTMHGVAIYTGNRQRGGGLIDPSILAESRKIYRATRPEVIPASPQ